MAQRYYSKFDVCPQNGFMHCNFTEKYEPSPQPLETSYGFAENVDCTGDGWDCDPSQFNKYCPGGAAVEPVDACVV